MYFLKIEVETKPPYVTSSAILDHINMYFDSSTSWLRFSPWDGVRRAATRCDLKFNMLKFLAANRTLIAMVTCQSAQPIGERFDSTWCLAALFDCGISYYCLFVCGISLTSGQLIIELFPDCTRSCFSQVDQETLYSTCLTCWPMAFEWVHCER